MGESWGRDVRLSSHGGRHLKVVLGPLPCPPRPPLLPLLFVFPAPLFLPPLCLFPFLLIFLFVFFSSVFFSSSMSSSSHYFSSISFLPSSFSHSSFLSFSFSSFFNSSFSSWATFLSVMMDYPCYIKENGDTDTEVESVFVYLVVRPVPVFYFKPFAS